MDHEAPADHGAVDDDESEFQHRLGMFRELVESARGISAAVAWWTDEGDPEINVIGARDRVMLAGEYARLSGRGHTRCHERVGLLRAPRSGRVVALTRAVVLPDRLPPPVRERLGVPHPDGPEHVVPTRVPIGVAMAELGDRAVRVDRTVRSIIGRRGSIGEDLVLETTGVWVVDGLPAVLAGEEILRDLLTEYAPPGRLEHFRGLADRLHTDAPTPACATAAHGVAC
ncbi:MAG: hypothetical protein HOV94_05355 [Saccharothrix sp.]|nr:hypothetical protein [Saccharothrix sp.]